MASFSAAVTSYDTFTGSSPPPYFLPVYRGQDMSLGLSFLQPFFKERNLHGALQMGIIQIGIFRGWLPD